MLIGCKTSPLRSPLFCRKAKAGYVDAAGLVSSLLLCMSAADEELVERRDLRAAIVASFFSVSDTRRA